MSWCQAGGDQSGIHKAERKAIEVVEKFLLLGPARKRELVEMMQRCSYPKGEVKRGRLQASSR